MKKKSSCSIVLLIPSLDIGGAEVQLVNLARGLHENSNDLTVLTFYNSGKLLDDLKSSGVPTLSLEKRGRWDIFGFLRRYAIMLNEIKPDVVYSFLGTPNIIASLMKPFSTGGKIVWGIRYSEIELHHYDLLSRFSYRIERLLSFLPDMIIANSEAGREYAHKRGFPWEKIVVVYNGIDTDRFFISPEGGKRLRSEWKIEEGERLIGTVGRFDPIKDYETFLSAASIVAKKFDNARFIFVGDGPKEYIDSLKALAERLGLKGKIVWAGYRNDMNGVYNALDIIVSSSASEGFSNVICEAMACGVYPVVTNVGDSATIVGGHGRVVNPSDPNGLAEGIISCLLDDRMISPNKIRERIVKNFNIDLMVSRTEKLLKGLCGEGK